MLLQIVSVAAAGLGVVFSVAFLFMGIVAIKMLRDVRDSLAQRRG